MKNIFVLIMLICSILLATDGNTQNEQRIKKQLEIEMEKEKRYSIEQTFYQKDNYDFKGSEVNEDSLENVPGLELDDLDMDSVYD
ncbi:MAG: hypothetical protein U9R39_01305 [Campylobacterota bacterium]|nr:hypothetical protein [Campylobacterota bacterium]